MSTDSNDLVVVLTGASSGIGHATALALAREGVHLVLAARGEEGLQSVADECEQIGGRPLTVPVDVADGEAVARLAEFVLERFGRIDVWINNVGVGAVGLFEDTPLQAHRRVIETNLIGHLNGAHAAISHFKARRRGTLINMISLGGWVPSPLGAAYTASKFGLRGLSEALRAEVSGLPDVHVCAVYPTFVDTPGFAHGANYTGKHLEPPSPLVDPWEVARAMVALIHSPRATTSIGSVAWPARAIHAAAPDPVARCTFSLTRRALERARPTAVSDGNLFEPSDGHAIEGGYRRSHRTAAWVAGSAAVGALIWALGRLLSGRLPSSLHGDPT
jgi:short-subunit dehydrogenase